MSPSFLPRLVNGPFDDPGLYIPFFFDKRAILFDLGDIHALPPRDILKISHIFVTHTHMDHFSGFDRVLRLMLGRDKELFLFGPEGFIKNVEGKLAGYTWNLIKNYKNEFNLHVSEIRSDGVLKKTYACNQGFASTAEAEYATFNGTLVSEPQLEISCAILDHGIPCLGFSLNERFHVNIMNTRLDGLGLVPGPWLNAFKKALYDKKDPDTIFHITVPEKPRQPIQFSLRFLADRIARITPGQKITYISDVGYTRQNRSRIIKLAENATHLFMETAFLETHKETADRKKHLTAWQAGTLAKQAGAGQLYIFHYSPRYTDQRHRIEEEAKRAFGAPVIKCKA